MAVGLVALDIHSVHNTTTTQPTTMSKKLNQQHRTPGFYGAEVEAWVVQKYGLERTYREVEGVRLDAVEPDSGRAVEIKAVAANRVGGRANSYSWKVWKDQHDVLKRVDGYYVFVAYDLLADGVGIRRSRAVEASAMSISWYGRTEPRGERQAELLPSEVFKSV